VGEQMEKDTWLLKGSVRTPLFIIVRFFHNSLKFFRMQAYDLSESKIAVGVLGPSLLFCFKAPSKSNKG